jgi:hypothetical protein
LQNLSGLSCLELIGKAISHTLNTIFSKSVLIIIQGSLKFRLKVFLSYVILIIVLNLDISLSTFNLLVILYLLVLLYLMVHYFPVTKNKDIKENIGTRL